MNSSLSDSIYGMEGYDWQGKVIGGRIKSAPSDFVVIELDGDRKVDVITYEESNSGLFLAGKVWKKQIDHGHMIKLIAKNFGVQEDDISTAGIKDAYAETTQLFSVYQPRKIPVDPFQPVLNLEISNYHYRREKVFPGSMGGNYFKIKITDCDIIDVSELDEFGRWARKGVLNYFGYQRFGSSRPITAQMGRLLLQKKYEDAINLYLGAVSSASN
ncbi:MAG: tRNA pseudouridine(13) synthase TruD, partial [Candidatus Heimdallarchaeota archaeon]